MLDINNLSLSYGTQKVLKNLTISLQKGEIGCILGPSGCGKTTLLRAIAGFKSVQVGSISVNDIVVSDAAYKMPVAKTQDWRGVSGFCFISTHECA